MGARVSGDSESDPHRTLRPETEQVLAFHGLCHISYFIFLLHADYQRLIEHCLLSTIAHLHACSQENVAR